MAACDDIGRRLKTEGGTQVRAMSGDVGTVYIEQVDGGPVRIMPGGDGGEWSGEIRAWRFVKDRTELVRSDTVGMSRPV